MAKGFLMATKNEWTYEVMDTESTICTRLEQLEDEGWTIVAIVPQDSGRFVKVFMKRAH
jgi:hypothetical protein